MGQIQRQFYGRAAQPTYVRIYIYTCKRKSKRKGLYDSSYYLLFQFKKMLVSSRKTIIP
jgi:hypothetical protein